MVFDNTSTPRITELSGTIFGMVDTSPQIQNITGPAAPVVLGSSAAINVNYVLPASGEQAEVTFAWGDGQTTTVTGNSGSASATRQYATPGVYTVTVTVTGRDGVEASSFYQYVVVYDPNGAFVTGGGWIESPAGAYLPDPTLTGKATFGFVSKYLKGATVPSGNTEFQFKAGNLSFKSSLYQWLVVSGAKAQLKGSGQINGAGDFGFLLTLTDGQLAPGAGVDRLRIKIWDKSRGDAVVYDNGLGTADNLDSSNPQAIAGGSIVIQKAK